MNDVSCGEFVGACVDHVALRVRDLPWHVDFFEVVLGMRVSMRSEPGAWPEQVWLDGGIQLIACITDLTEHCSELLGHLGIKVNDLEDALDKAYAKGARELPQGRNWFSMPEGVCIELLQAGSIG